MTNDMTAQLRTNTTKKLRSARFFLYYFGGFINPTLIQPCICVYMYIIYIYISLTLSSHEVLRIELVLHVIHHTSSAAVVDNSSLSPQRSSLHAHANVIKCPRLQRAVHLLVSRNTTLFHLTKTIFHLFELCSSHILIVPAEPHFTSDPLQQWHAQAGQKEVREVVRLHPGLFGQSLWHVNDPHRCTFCGTFCDTF